MDELALELAREARRLRLDARQCQEADPEALQAFAQLVLTELAARGLVAGDDEIGCYAAPRSGRH
ncbi:hypothetical protein DEDE109153_05695 [Deinococcus deserti]|uniref:Uncharacterized protein n=1 Tax=Deinococcus deserti (strain DSM 17065 / CIP 109153 / LMG 22923 / VCD115) TaxID=546414 RepID=C1CYQ6_DEIDV|nr:hypothetical protein [Deinococcus deserti]ACO47086.1 hypothetical protein Deide_20645 [Deinococcus deserti VCD115]